MSASDALTSLNRPDWQHQAACRGAGPQFFFWEEFTFEQIKDEYYMSEKAFGRMTKMGREGIKREMEEKTKQDFCSICPVRAECGEAGKYESYGVWGGRTFEERFELLSEEEQKEFFNIRDIKVKTDG